MASQQGWCAGLVDANNAFLHAPLQVPVWGRPPSLFIRAGLVEKGELWRFKKAAYDLRSAPKSWAAELNKQFVSAVLPFNGKEIKIELVQDTTLTYRLTLDGRLTGTLIAYVDDISCVGPKEVVTHALQKVEGFWPCKPVVL